MLFKKEEIKDWLLLDIETVAQYRDYFQFKDEKPNLANIWFEKSKKYYDKHIEEMVDMTIFDKHDFIYQKYAGLYPEFGKIISISRGIIDENNQVKIANSSEAGEKELLTNFVNKLNMFRTNKPKSKIFGFNVIAFDIAYICKRLLINGLEIPNFINNADKKPWEVEMIDLMNIWKFGSYEASSLDLVCECLEIESPKNGIVVNKSLNHYYYNTKEPMVEIVKYNNADVKAMADIILKLSK